MRLTAASICATLSCRYGTLLRAPDFVVAVCHDLCPCQARLAPLLRAEPNHGDWGPWLFGLNMQTPEVVAVAKFSSASLIVIGVLVTARICGENWGSLYIRKGRLDLGMSVGAVGAAACLLLALRQPAVSSIGLSKLASLDPWILLFVVANGLMEELLFRGLFLGRYERLIGTWPAIISTALSFTLAHMQVKYAPELIPFLVVLLGLSIAWGWLMQKTRSLWGSTIFHAGADLLTILPIFKTFGAG